MLKELVEGMLHADDVQNMGGIIFDELPKARVTAMDNVLSAPYFILSLNEFTYGFQSISNIGRHREVTHNPEGGVNDHQIMVGRPNDNIYTLELSRGYIIHGPDAVLDKFAKTAISMFPHELARKLALIAVNSASPQSALENGPSVGFIQAFSRQKKLVAMFSFLSLGMVEWRLSDLNAASGGEPMIENITIEHTGLTMLPATWLPSIAQPIMGWGGATEDSMETLAEIMRQNKKDFEERKKKMQELEKEKKEWSEKRKALLEERDKLIKEENEKRQKAADERKAARDKQEADREDAQKEMEEAKKILDDENRAKIAQNTKEAEERQKDEAKNALERNKKRQEQEQEQDQEPPKDREEARDAESMNNEQ